MSALGIYPMNPVNGEYVFGSPVIDKAEIRLENGKRFTIEAKNNSKQNIYVQSVTLNEKKYNQKFITYDVIMAGGKLVFEMGKQPLTPLLSGENSKRE